jgi:threonine/homoserine/homoserine lactone efflux protein
MLPLVIAVALGIGAVVAQSLVLFTLIKFVGAGYLVYLGIQAIRHRRHTAVTHEAAPPRRSRLRILGEGFVVGLTNPKSLVFFVAVLPQFVDYRAGAIPLQLLELGTVFLVLALLSDSVWALAAGTAREWFGRSPKRVERLGATGGVMMIGLGGVLAFTGVKH